jgi:TonB family protein
VSAAPTSRLIRSIAAFTLVAAAWAPPLQASTGEPTAQGRSITEWLAVLRTNDFVQQQKAVAAINSMGAAAAPALLSVARSDASNLVRAVALGTLGELGGPGVAIVLAAAVERDPDSLSQWRAASGLDKLARRRDADAAKAIARLLPVLVARLGDPSASSDAARLLTAFGESANAAVIKAASDPNPHVRFAAVLALSDLRGRDVTAALIAHLGDSDAPVRSASAAALGVLVVKNPADGPAALPALTAALRDPDLHVQEDAAEALGKIGPGARPAIPALRGLLTHKELRVAAAISLTQIDPVGTAAETLPVLIEILKDPKNPRRISVPETLGALGPLAAPAIPALTAALKDPEPFIQTAAAEALVKVRPRPTATASLPRRPPVRVAGPIREPRKVKDVAAIYPANAKAAGAHGVVVLEALIDEGGRVSEVKVLRGIPGLDDAAMTAVKEWLYEPTLIGGQATPVILTITVNFRLS